jgi:hypothetical protein
MPRQSLTDDYLTELTAGGPTAEAIVDTVRDDVVVSCYRGRPLSRPVFLGRAEHQQVHDDLATVYSAITAMPDRLYGGDVAAFARAVGMTAEQAAVATRARGDAPTRLVRSDMHLDESGFRLMELNVGSTFDGLDNNYLNEAMLKHPFVADFVDQHDLTYIDSMAEVAHTIKTESKIAAGVRPVMVAVTVPDEWEFLEPRLVKNSEVLGPLGIESYGGHLGQLRYADGRVWFGEHPVDIVFRIWLTEHLRDETVMALVDPLLAAAERGEVAIFTPMDADIYTSKGALAMLSDEANQHVLTDRERAAVDRLLPWTRPLHSGPVTVDGDKIDLQQYLLDNRDELIIKPMLLWGGQGVTPGWLTEPDDWRQQVEAAMDGPYLVQQRIHPFSERFPSEDGLQPWTLAWSFLLMTRGAGGMWIRGTHGATSRVVNMTIDAYGTCCFIERSPD